MPGRQVLRCVMPGRQVLRMIDLPESSRLDGQALGGGVVGRRGGIEGWPDLARMMRISLLKMGQRSNDDDGF